MANDALIAFIGIGGVVVGGAIQYIATTINDRWKYKSDTRTEAYNAMTSSITKLANFTGGLARRGVTIPDEQQLTQLAALQSDFVDAKTKVALYGSRRVMRSLGDFSSRHAMLANDADYEAFIDFIEAMRADSYAESYDGFRQDVDNLMLRGSMR